MRSTNTVRHVVCFPQGVLPQWLVFRLPKHISAYGLDRTLLQGVLPQWVVFRLPLQMTGGRQTDGSVDLTSLFLSYGFTDRVTRVIFMNFYVLRCVSLTLSLTAWRTLADL